MQGRCGAGAAARQKDPQEVQLEKIYAQPRAALRITTVVPDNKWGGHGRMWWLSQARSGSRQRRNLLVDD